MPHGGRPILAGAVVAALLTTLAPAASAAPSPAARGTTTRVATGLSVPVAPDAPVTTTTIPLSSTVDTASRASLGLPVEIDEEHAGTVGRLAVLTPARATTDFDLVGVTWDEGADVERVLVRTRHDDAWSSWTELEIDPEAPDAGTAEARGARPGTTPYVRTGADGLQVRVETPTGIPPTGLAATLVDAGVEDLADAKVSMAPDAAGVAVGTAGEAAPAATAGVSPASLRPALVTREQWKADESIRKAIDWSSTIQAAVVHHTVNANTYSKAQAPALVRGIYEYHVKGRGWSDVGYHFLVDRFGTVYEGRKGSIDKIPLGVHSGGFNTNTIGIAIIGEFTGTVPPDEALRSVAQVAAWKLATFVRDPLGTTVLTAREGSTHPVRKPGWKGSLPVIMGHRDVASTACPGQKTYDRLGTIRTYAGQQVDRVASRGVVTWANPGTPVVAQAYSAATTSWTATVQSACAGSVVRTFSGKGRGWFDVAWDGKRDSGANASAGVYKITTTRHGVSDAVWVERLPSGGAGKEICGLSRWGGLDRWATAVALAGARSSTSDEVVLVAGTQASIVDGLVAGPFARSRKAPVLLSARDALPAATRDEIKRRAPKTVWLVGGTGVLSTALSDELRRLGVGDVKRLAGDDRYETAAAVARAMPATSQVLLASGEQAHLVDAAAAGGAAAATKQPILLTVRKKLPPSTRSTIIDRGITRTTIVGGPGAVSEATAEQVKFVTKGTVVRYAGDDRYGTALATARGFAERVGTSRVVVAAGKDAHLIDSVTAGALARLVVLVPGASGHTEVQRWLTSAGTKDLDLAGGPGAITPATARLLIGAVR